MQRLLTEQFEAALIYATRLHCQQRRKVSGTPYVAHLLGVAALVLEDGGSEAEAIAALLHDGVEDQGGLATRTAIYEKFGEQVGAIVDACTEWSAPPKPAWKERKLRYLEQLQQAPAPVRRVSLADKLHNLRSLLMDWRFYGDTMWSEFKSSPSDALWFYQSLLPIYRELNGSRMVGELEQAIAEFEHRMSLNLRRSL